MAKAFPNTGVTTGLAADRTALTSPYAGMQFFETDNKLLYIYNGTAWVCITPKSATVTTAQSTTAGQTTYVDLTTSGPEVTIATGTTALVTLSARVKKFLDSYVAHMSFAVSGATTISASDDNSIMDWSYAASASNYVDASLSRTFLLTGLTAGDNTFTAKYKDNSAFTTATFAYRSIVVVGIP